MDSLRLYPPGLTPHECLNMRFSTETLDERWVEENRKLYKVPHLSDSAKAEVSNMAQTEEYTYTVGKYTLNWGRLLSKRKASGYVGEETVNVQFRIPEIVQIMSALGSTAKSPRKLAEDFCKYFKVEAPADKTDPLAQAVLNAFKMGKSAQEIATRLRELNTSEEKIQELLPELNTVIPPLF